ncbi:methyltransferase domain-containing protein [Opitutus sp. GAS368]|uniref:methyltransferase domain-containing protein n=1 Tax=Opitutus sp. GAS368 TaxID=1882749 RepID=UPI00087B080B|nr:methyltransferase domain-containing protein [Opitutus sp. GAS368]SDR67360.1 23S rRNA (guanine745-N1)-methyltransferase [Opitutus sp. GAS368]
MSLTCPLCHGALIPVEKSYRCSKGHSFDLAREGYLSLLHGRQKGEGRGDSKAMMLARDRVHRAGVFDPLVSALAALPFETPPRTLLELGCGEGFFLGHMAKSHGIATSYGLDLSVDAVKLSARTLKQSLILRADLLQALPFADGSLDLVQSIFAPRPLAEIKRVLRPGGYALFVYPQGDHWQELRAFLPLAGIGEDKLPANLEGFAATASLHVTEKLALPHAVLVDLVEMSPSIHRLTREGTPWQTLLPASLAATLSLRLALFRKDRNSDLQPPVLSRINA